MKYFLSKKNQNSRQEEDGKFFKIFINIKKLDIEENEENIEIEDDLSMDYSWVGSLLDSPSIFHFFMEFSFYF